MTGILYHDVPEAAAELETRLRGVLNRMPDGTGLDLLGRLVFETQPIPVLAVTGAYSTGKSTLIKALTDGQAVVTIGADVTTDSVTPYDWDGVVTLLDTPGVHAGFEDHDLLAEDALSRADLVLFTVTVDLFDDDATKQVRYVADTLGKRDQILVVINKMNTMAAAAGLRREAVIAALVGGPIPVSVECDAADYLESLSESDQHRRDLLRAHSGVDEVKAGINDLARSKGELARFRQPFQLMKALAMDAASRLVVDPAEQATLTVLARQQKALVSHAARIDSALQSHRAEFRAASGAAAESFADAVETVDDEQDVVARTRALKGFTDQLHEDLNAASASLGRGIENSVRRLLEDLGAEVEEITSGEHARYIAQMTAPDVEQARGSHTGVFGSVGGRGPSGATKIPGWLYEAQDWVGKFQQFWGAGGGMSRSAGSTGHRVVFEVGHLFGAKFQPWGAVRVANALGNAAKVATVAIPVALVVAGTILEEKARLDAERARQKRRNRLLSEVMRQADRIADEAEHEVHQAVDPQFEAAYSNIESVRADIVAGQTHRTDLETEIKAIHVECQERLAQLSLPMGG